MRSNSVRREKTFCPRCGFTDVFWASGLPQIRSVWDCRHCGYRGAFIVRDGKLADKLGEEYARKVAKDEVLVQIALVLVAFLGSLLYCRVSPFQVCFGSS